MGRGRSWLPAAEQLHGLPTEVGQRLQEQCCVAEGLLFLDPALTSLHCLAPSCASGSLSADTTP